MAEEERKSKTVWNTNNGNVCIAWESPLEPDVYHLPADTCEVEPPSFDEETQVCTFDGTNWNVGPIPEEDNEPVGANDPGDFRTWNAMMVMRSQRTALLEKTDIYLAVNDFPMDEATKEAWATYRRELRDLPNKYPNPQWGDDGKITNMIWPRNPDGYSDPSEIFEVLR